MAIVAREQHGPFVLEQCLRQCLDRFDVEMVARLVEHQDVVRAQQQARHTQPGSFASRKHRDLFMDMRVAEQQRSQLCQDLLIGCSGVGLVFEVFEYGLILRQTGVDMLCVRADLASVTPTHFAFARCERTDECPQQSRLSLAVITDDGGSCAMLDLQHNPRGDIMVRIADRQVDAANGWPLTRLDDRGSDAGGGVIHFDLGRFQAIELLLFRSRLTRRIGTSSILVDETLELLLFRLDRRVDSQVMFAAFFLKFEKGVDLAGVHRQFAARDIERVRTRRFQKRPVVRHDQTRFAKPAEEMFEQDLSSHIEEIRRLVQQQQVRLVQQQRRQLNTCLPTSRQLGDRPFEIRSLQFKLSRNLTALPVRLRAVSH